MLSLVGELVHVSKVVTPGRTFLRRMLDIAHSWPSLNHWICLDLEFRADVMWWHVFVDQWNGMSLFVAHVYQAAIMVMFTDASGSWGCGATDGNNWFQYARHHNWSDVNIATKELVPIIQAVSICGGHWANTRISFHSDNIAVVEVMQFSFSKDSKIMHLLQCLHYLCVRHGIQVSFSHIPGKDNIPADASSRNYLDLFFAPPLRCCPTHLKCLRSCGVW